MSGSKSATSTALPRIRADRVICNGVLAAIPVPLSIKTRISATSWSMTKKKIAGRSIARNSSFSFARSLLMVRCLPWSKYRWYTRVAADCCNAAAGGQHTPSYAACPDSALPRASRGGGLKHGSHVVARASVCPLLGASLATQRLYQALHFAVSGCQGEELFSIAQRGLAVPALPEVGHQCVQDVSV